MSIQIIEIIGRASQGVTKPFICRGEDDEIYFVKGFGAGRRSLICEWVAGGLAVRLGLPVAPFEIVQVPEALISLGSRADLAELGAGLAFGSRRLKVVELSRSHLAHIPVSLQRAVLAFDWWIRNADRTLSEEGGNPNLFWDVQLQRLVVIDHNQAFDEEFSERNFSELHAFHEQIDTLCGDWVIRQECCAQFDAALAGWDEICNTVPAEWWFIDPEQTIVTNFGREEIRQLLSAYRSDAFWNMRK
jgi:hypothetical protein